MEAHARGRTYRWKTSQVFLAREFENLTVSRSESCTRPFRNELAKDMNSTQAVRILQSVVSPLLLFVGLLGNCISLLMMRRRNLRGLTTCFYLFCLSAADLCCVCFGLFPVFLFSVTSGDINARWWLDCKLMDFCTYLSTDVSIWIVVVMTIDRYIATCQPVLSIKVCNRRVAKRLVFAIVVAMLCVNGHLVIFYKYGLEPNSTNSQQDCVPSDNSANFFHKIWPWMDFSVYALVPDTIIFTFNAIIIRSIMIKHRRSLNTTTANFRRQTFKMTKVLLVVSSVTLLCTAPITIMQIVEEYDSRDRVEWSSWNLAFAIGNLLMYTNHCINFILFCLTGSRFRRELSLMMGMRNNIIHTSTGISLQERALEETIH